MEVWREVPGYDGWYECSDQGRVRSWRTPGNNGSGEQPRADQPRILKQAHTRGDYLFVGLSDSGSVWQVRVNRLVLLTFAGEPDDPSMQACHRDGDRQNNSLDNLYWGTAEENCSDKVRHGTQLKGEQMPFSKLTADKVRELRELWGSGEHTVRDLAERFNVSGPTLWKAATGKTWSHV